jgi:hypothetical protein
MTPVFTFERTSQTAYYKGHGKYFMSQIAIEKWGEKEGELLFHSPSASD